MPVSINSQFDSGNIELVDISDQDVVKLKIRNDTFSDYLQWFHFSVSGVSGRSCAIQIVNAGQTTYPRGWEGYDVVTSTDRQHWYRAPTQFDGQTLSWTLNTQSDVVWFAYFAPYSTEQHTDLIAAAASAPSVEYENLGITCQGRSIDYLTVSALPMASANDSVNRARLQLWVIGRQHPGESMAEWWMEGFLGRLLDEDNASSRALRKLADIHVVPNMNPDGAALGNLRTNALGINLNREWANPSLANSPEVYWVRQKMTETGIDLALDVHGDEALPYNFIAGTEGIEGWSEERDRELVQFKHSWAAINPDFQYKHGYPRNSPGNANLAICSNNLAASFNCLAMTLEMPFKDTADTPQSETGWSAERSIRLGASFVDAARLSLTGRLIS